MPAARAGGPAGSTREGEMTDAVGTERRAFGHIYKRGETYWIRDSVNGRRYRESTESSDLRKAERLLGRKEAELGLGVFTAPAVKRTTFDDLARIIRDEYRVNGRKSADTLGTQLHRLELAFAGARATSITPD